ncbi:MAG TPA: acylphosphatase [Gemmatimonadales bacterium]|nr:acylphosphatase [Gemmatimonadales bacterium]
MADAARTRCFLVHGLVQGVGFRWFVRVEARRRGLAGSVRNLPDGSVEVVVQGPASLISGLETALARGPAGARVDHLEELPTADRTALPDPFQIE